jgi:hypothetical protein
MRLVKEMKAGKEFKVAPQEKSKELEPLDIDLLHELRKKHNL